MSRGLREMRVSDGGNARHRRGEGGAFPSLLNPVNQKYHRRAFVAVFEVTLHFLQKRTAAVHIYKYIYTH